MQAREKSRPTYKGLRPASARASSLARAASLKRDTRAEIALRRALWRRGLRYKVDVATLPGRPDIVFVQQRVVIFCDGDFWHGRRLRQRLARLAAGHNAPYWVPKIQGNVARDRRRNRELRNAGWVVLRFWETDILRDAETAANRIERVFPDAPVGERVSKSSV